MKELIKTSDFTFDALYSNLILPLFADIDARDERKVNKKYQLTSALKSGYALFALKAPSLFSFHQQTEAEKSNLKSIFKIDENLSDNGLRTILDRVDSDQIRSGFHQVINYLSERNILSAYTSWNNHLLISVDGVEHFKSKKINCPCCMKRLHRDGSTSYYHSMLSAAIVHPNQSEVFIADNEPIVKQDGAVKNDCERNAAKRLFAKLNILYGSQSIVYALDALYSCAPIIEQITANKNWKFISNITEKGHKHLFSQFNEMNENNEVEWTDFRRKRDRYSVGFVNNLELNESNSDVKVNLLYCKLKPAGQPEKVFSWVTNIPITKTNLKDIIDMGRSRWKIENEVFNTLKNQDYNFEHNFGHGEKNLATNFAYLMMLAFTIDQIQQRCSRYFRSLHRGLKTRVKIWEATRSIFNMIPCEGMEHLQANLLKMYQIQLI